MSTAERVKWVQTLRRGALGTDIHRIPQNAARTKVKEMALRVLECTGLQGAERKAMEEAWANYRDSWPDWRETGGDAGQEMAPEDETKKTWYFPLLN